MPSNALANLRVAILEDDPRNRGRLSNLVTMSGGVPVPASPRAPALTEFSTYLERENVSLVVCDHRLFERGNYACYTGAAAVAASYHSGRGGVLVTAWEKEDSELSIREYRRWIPALIQATDLDRSILEKALLQADREVRGNSPIRERVPHRTIMTVQRFEQRGTEQVVKVVMSQWNTQDEVGFPMNIVPQCIRAKLAPGMLLIAQVNVEAMSAEDLFFDSFELPDSDALRKSKTLFSGA